MTIDDQALSVLVESINQLLDSKVKNLKVDKTVEGRIVAVKENNVYSIQCNGVSRDVTFRNITDGSVGDTVHCAYYGGSATPVIIEDLIGSTSGTATGVSSVNGMTGKVNLNGTYYTKEQIGNLLLKYSKDLHSNFEVLEEITATLFNDWTNNVTDTNLHISNSFVHLSTAQKNKLDGIEEEANKTVLDDIFSETSLNPATSKATAIWVKNLIANNGIAFKIVDALPITNISTSVIYLLTVTSGGTTTYDMYINLDGTSEGWTNIGSTSINLADYYTRTEADNQFATITNLGDKTLLETTDKSSIVNALNEVNTKCNEQSTVEITRLRDSSADNTFGTEIGGTGVQSSLSRIMYFKSNEITNANAVYKSGFYGVTNADTSMPYLGCWYMQVMCKDEIRQIAVQIAMQVGKSGNGEFWIRNIRLNASDTADGNMIGTWQQILNISKLNERIGSNELTELTTTDKTSIINAINELKANIDTQTTDIDTLNTSITNLTTSVNNRVGTALLTDLTTVDKSSLVAAINEVKSGLDEISAEVKETIKSEAELTAWYTSNIIN